MSSFRACRPSRGVYRWIAIQARASGDQTCADQRRGCSCSKSEVSFRSAGCRSKRVRRQAAAIGPRARAPEHRYDDERDRRRRRGFPTLPARVVDPVIGSQSFSFSARRQPRSACPSMSRARCAPQLGQSVRSTASWSRDSRFAVVTDTCRPHRGQGDSLTALDKALFLRLVDRDLASDRVRIPLRHIPLPIRLACRRLVRAINCPLKRLGECWRLA